MSVFRLNRLQYMYSMLLRLHEKSNYPQWVGVLSERKLSSLKRCHVQFSYVCQFHHYRNVTSVQQNTAECGKINPFPQPIKENDYAHNLFLSSVKYVDSVASIATVYAYVTNEEALGILEQDWNVLEPEDLVSSIKKLAYNIQYSEKNIDPLKYQDAFNALTKEIEKLSDDRLIIIMKHLIPLRKLLKDHIFYCTVFEKLDWECTKRFMQLPINRMLLLCDLFHQLHCKSNSHYIWYSMRKLGNKPSKLNPQQLVQVLFFLNICRRPPINMYEMEYRLEECFDELSINELGVASMGFFKTGTSIKSTVFLNRIMKKTINNMELLDSVSIGAILKLIRYSMRLTEINTLENLTHALIPHMPRFTLMSLTHMAHACTRVALYHQEFMDALIKRSNNELKYARLKDLERLVFVFASLNVDPVSNDIYHNIIEELRATWDTSRANEIMQYPHAASRILGFLSYVNMYPTDLIKRVMTPEFIHNMFNGDYRSISREYCILHYGLTLEVPDYDGSFLKPSLCRALIKKHFMENVSPDFTKTNILLMSVLKTCQEIFNNTSDISVNRLLPHYVTSDIIICLNEKNELVPCGKFLSGFSEEEIKRVDEEHSKNVRWFALVMASDSLLIRDSNLLTGLLAARIRQLSLIGYTPLIVSYVDWYECKTTEKRRNYIKNLLFKNNLKKTSSARIN